MILPRIYLNNSYLSTIFSAQTNLRFIDYLTKVKMQRAAVLIKSTDMKISDIAQRLDYKDIGYFSRVFKKYYGVTPTMYKIPEGFMYQI